MKYTNLLQLPEALVRAICNDPYSKGDAEFSVTELLKPPRAVVLQARHEDEITEDVADRIFALTGQIGHAIIERGGAGVGEEIVEKRFFATIGDCRVSGAGDIVKTAQINRAYDWKFTTWYGYKDGVKPEYVAQLNMIRLLAYKEDGIEIDELISAPIFRDWSKGEARRDRFYPQKQVMLFPVPVWTYKQTEEFMLNRIALHRAARKELPECTAAERWASPDTWKVYKDSASTRALPGGVFVESSDADNFASQKNGREVRLVRGVSVRCRDYCSAAPFCVQAKAYLNAEADTEN